MGWYNKFPEGQLADAILERIAYDSYLIEIQYIDKEHDKSMRELYGIKENNWRFYSRTIGTSAK